MQDIFSKLSAHQIEDYLIILTVLSACLIAFLTVQWRWHRRTEIEASLKQDMLNRGMGADEIERVLRASMSGRRAGCRRQRESVYPSQADR